jgi:hypothetical protein
MIRAAKTIHAFNWIILIVELPFLGGIGQLFAFHCYLIKNKMTTFDYIMAKKDKIK